MMSILKQINYNIYNLKQIIYNKLILNNFIKKLINSAYNESKFMKFVNL